MGLDSSGDDGCHYAAGHKTRQELPDDLERHTPLALDRIAIAVSNDLRADHQQARRGDAYPVENEFERRLPAYYPRLEHSAQQRQDTSECHRHGPVAAVDLRFSQVPVNFPDLTDGSIQFHDVPLHN